jgi:hypothetical protein
MKVTMEVDCTPEEARRFLGLPDVTRANEIYVEALANAMKGGGSFEQMQEVIKQVAPMGQLGLKLFQQFIENSAGMTGMGGSPRKGDH